MHTTKLLKMSNLALQRFINGAFREEELATLMAIPSFCAVFQTIATFDDAEALIEVGNRLLIEAQRKDRSWSGDVQSL